MPQAGERPTEVGVLVSDQERLLSLRANKKKPRLPYLTDRGRLNHGPTPPGASIPCERESELTQEEVREVIQLIADSRRNRATVVMPERLRTRSWKSVDEVMLNLEIALGWKPAGWKVGAASMAVRIAENLPNPSPGRLFERSIFQSPATISPEFFINYRVCESEFAFQLCKDFEVRTAPYAEEEVRDGIDSLIPALEIGDSVFEDWYALPGYLGAMYDNAGGAAFVMGKPIKDWQGIDLPNSNIDIYVNGSYIKSGTGIEAMGDPVTSLTWMINYAVAHGRAVKSGEIISTGTCTGHTFVAPGDLVSLDFGALGLVEAKFS
jgi:2-keto-4-pentenoate hydratase